MTRGSSFAQKIYTSCHILCHVAAVTAAWKIAAASLCGQPLCLEHISVGWLAQDVFQLADSDLHRLNMLVTVACHELHASDCSAADKLSLYDIHAWALCFIRRSYMTLCQAIQSVAARLGCFAARTSTPPMPDNYASICGLSCLPAIVFEGAAAVRLLC